MTLYLLRHAEAEVLAPSDSARRLTPKGEEQAERVGKFCRRHEIAPAIILTSPVTRARQTAEIAARQLGDIEMVEVPWAACGMDPFSALKELAVYDKFSSVLLVGHQPDLGALASVLMGIPHLQSMRVRKALLLGIEMAHGPKSGGGVLQFFLPVKLM